MEIELRTFANFRDAVGQKTVRREYDDRSVRAGDVLRSLEAEYPELELFDDVGSLQEFITILKNGREITYIDGLDTELEDGDTLSVFPPVAGG
jgi:molybdopterin synthase sulfur carrier subunit